MNNNEENNKTGTGKVVYIVIGMLLSLILGSVTINFYLLNKVNETKKSVEDNKALAEYLNTNKTTVSQLENSSVKLNVPGKATATSDTFTEAYNNLLLVCLKKGVLPFNTGNYSIEQIRAYTVMAKYNVFVEDFGMIAGDKAIFDEEIRNDVKAKEFYYQWEQYEQSVNKKKNRGMGMSNTPAKIYKTRLEAINSIFLKVFGQELSDEEKALFTVKKST